MHRTLKRGTALLEGFESRLTSYDLFAASVAAMLAAHLFATFGRPEGAYLWTQVPLRIFIPVFLFSIGYNTGRRVGRSLWICAGAMLFMQWSAFHGYFPFFPVTPFVTIILTRLFLERLMEAALRSRARFLAVNAILVALIVPTHLYVADYGTYGVIMAMLGWLVRNERDVPKKIVDVRAYCIFAYCVHVAFVHAFILILAGQFAAVVLGSAYVFRLLYGFRARIVSALRRKPRDMVEKICGFLGHKTLELFMLMVLVLQFFLYYALTFPPR